MRLIDADRINYDIYEDDSGTKFVVIRIDDLSQIPTVEAKPVRHGKWIEAHHGSYVRCTVCKTAFIDDHEAWPYCPVCGAKMEVESGV